MALIRCTTDADGNVTPVTLEFEPGDLLEVQSGDSIAEPDTLSVVTGVFILASVSVDENSLITLVSSSGDPAPIRTMPDPDPKLPPPPPEDGASKFGHNRTSPIKLVIDGI